MFTGSTLTLKVMQRVSRRLVLHGALSAAATLGVPRSVMAQSSSASRVTEEIAPGLVLQRGRVNGLAFSGDDGVILVDAPAPDSTDSADPYGQARILFNTNWRPEHTAANDVLGAAGKRIIAHENTRLWMTNDFTVQWENHRYLPRAAHALPNDPFYTGDSLEFAGELIEYSYLPRAHTDGDIWVFFRRANVLAVSDLLAVDGYPVVDYSTGGWIGGFRDATRRLLEVANDATIIVPAVGQPQRRLALEAQLELCEATYEIVGQAYVNAMSLDELLASRPLKSWETDRGDPNQFLKLAYRSAWGHLRAMGLGVV